jgi:hypothetical protein
MADTGNPWFIPFAEPSDLVRDWPALSSAVGTAVAAGLTAANIALGPNVVSTLKNDTFSTSSTSFVAVTGLAASITPSSTSSKVLVIVTLNGIGVSTGTASPFQQFNVRRDTTDIGQPSAGSTPATIQATLGNVSPSMVASASIVLLDSPATESPISYNVTMRTSIATSYLNRRGSTADETTVSSITVIEVAA